jgi:4'-phosphopantetheinyl transferase
MPRVLLPSNEAHVWRIFLDDAATLALCRDSWLTPEEKRRADSFRFSRDRQRFVIRRGIARVILSRYLDLGPRHVRFRSLANGKPVLAEEIRESDFTFNWSHSDGMAHYVVVRGQRPAVDLERRRPDVEYLQIAESFFAPGEVATLRALAGDLQMNVFFTLWTCKEAWVKAAEVGLSFTREQVEVRLDTGGAATLLSHDGRSTPAAAWSVRTLAPAGGYAAAVVTEGWHWQLRCWPAPSALRAAGVGGQGEDSGGGRVLAEASDALLRSTEEPLSL